MEPWQSWLAIFAVSGAAYVYYTKAKDPAERKPSDTSKGVPFRTKTDQRNKSQVPALESPKFHIEDEKANGTATPKKAKKQKQKKQPQQATPVSSTPETARVADETPEPTSDDKEWAQQLSAARQGVKLSVPEKTQRQKSPKRSKATAATQENWDEPGPQGDIPSNVSEGKPQPVTTKAGDAEDARLSGSRISSSRGIISLKTGRLEDVNVKL